MTARKELHKQADANARPDTLHSQHDVSAHAPATATVADGLAAFVAFAHGIQHWPAAEHSSEKPAGPGPACGAREDTLPKHVLTPFPRTDSGLSECQTPVAARADSGLPAAETPIAPTPRPSAARKVRSVVPREDILEELHVAVRLREAPLPRRQKLQSSWD